MKMMMVIQCAASISSIHEPHHLTAPFSLPQTPFNLISATSSSSSAKSSPTTRRALLSLSTVSTALGVLAFCRNHSCWSKAAISEFFELQNSGGVKALDLRIGEGEVPVDGNQTLVSDDRLTELMEPNKRSKCAP
ncbi:unnamed protein product [Ilex paraguariensis]|uniref:Uncharacterized protein n=1 Tax=Ilex paraguariensis TaxID=185542 RepID=A0ABC8V1G9_9AQUA